MLINDRLFRETRAISHQRDGIVEKKNPRQPSMVMRNCEKHTARATQSHHSASAGVMKSHKLQSSILQRGNAFDAC